MKRKIVVLWIISYLAVSSAKAQFNTVSDNVCRYKVRKVEEKFLLPANQPVDSIQANLLQQETDSKDSKQKQWISSYPSITYPLKSIKVTLTDFTLHFSCCFTKILHSQLNPLLNNFTMQEKCY